MVNELMYQVMQALRQTDEWDRLWKEDPGIQQAKERLDRVMEQVVLKISGTLMDELWAAIFDLTANSENTALLYGIRVAEVIHDIATNPTEFSKYAAERRAEVRRG